MKNAMLIVINLDKVSTRERELMNHWAKEGKAVFCRVFSPSFNGTLFKDVYTLTKNQERECVNTYSKDRLNHIDREVFPINRWVDLSVFNDKGNKTP